MFSILSVSSYREEVCGSLDLPDRLHEGVPHYYRDVRTAEGGAMSWQETLESSDLKQVPLVLVGRRYSSRMYMYLVVYLYFTCNSNLYLLHSNLYLYPSVLCPRVLISASVNICGVSPRFSLNISALACASGRSM